MCRKRKDFAMGRQNTGKRKRAYRKHKPVHKAEIAIESLRTGTTNEVARRFMVTPSQVVHWRNLLVKSSPVLFMNTTSVEKDRSKEYELLTRIEELEKLNSDLEAEVENLYSDLTFMEEEAEKYETALASIRVTFEGL